MEKRGLSKRSQSEVITTVLIILLVIVAVFIVYVAVRNIIKSGTAQAGASSSKFDVALITTGASIEPRATSVDIPVSRKAGAGNISEIRIIFKDSAGKSICIYSNRTDIPKELETVIYNVSLTGACSGAATYEVYPVIISNGKEVVGMKAIVTGGGGGNTGGGCSVSCGISGFVGSLFCNVSDNKLYQNYTAYTCSGSTCTNVTASRLNKTCQYGCELGSIVCNSAPITGNVIEIDSCDDSPLNQEGKTYKLINDVQSAGTCLTIAANNVALDGNGKSITYGTGGVSGYGVNVNGYNNLTLKSANIIEGNAGGDYKHAVYLRSSNYSTVQNNNITMISSGGYGFYLFSSSNNTINSNMITTKNDSSGGINLYADSKSNNIFSNTVSTRGSYAYGIWVEGLSGSADSNNITSNVITTTGALSPGVVVRGFVGTSAQLNTISSNILNVSSSNRLKIWMQTAINNIFINNSIINRNYSYYDIEFSGTEMNIGNWFIDQYLENYSILTASKIYVKNSQFGEIRFTKAVSGTGTNLSNDIQIGNNLTYTNPARTGLNKSAEITLYGITFTPTGVKRDNVVCSSPACSTVTSLGDNKYKFTVQGAAGSYALYET